MSDLTEVHAEGQHGEWWVYVSADRTRLNITHDDGSGGTWTLPTDDARTVFLSGLAATTPSRWTRAWLAFQKRPVTAPPVSIADRQS
jgi:hypothetical protein